VSAVRTSSPTVEAVGFETLARMADVEGYNSWVYRQIRPYLGARVLEVGCGIGNMTGYYVDRHQLVCVDLLPESLALVRRKFPGRPNLHTMQGDICTEATITSLASYEFDTAILLNVLEHIENDARALTAIHRLLAPGGHLVLLVPAGRYLYGTLDHALGHYRRYELADLRALLISSGYSVQRLHYMNLAGILGWFLNSRALRRTLLPRPQLALFNILAPLFERLEGCLTPPRGQSLLAICRKPARGDREDARHPED
jgi:SAM-dependent methyltransferase